MEPNRGNNVFFYALDISIFAHIDDVTSNKLHDQIGSPQCKYLELISNKKSSSVMKHEANF